MEIGESISPPKFTIEDDDLHDEKTCPWCQPKKKQGKSQKLQKQSPNTDAVGAIPPNDGGKLGQNLEAAKNIEPRHTVTISYKRVTPVPFQSGKKKKTKNFPVYKKSSSDEDYEVQYAPHHLIPGNGSLKGSAVVPFMGDSDSIDEYSEGQASKIKEDGFIGYDVNAAENGEWLPSPYALSMCNDWPSEKDVQVLKRRRLGDFKGISEEFKTAYVAAAIETFDRQFHMSHGDYEDKVREILDTVAERLALMSDGGICPEAQKNKSSDGKFDPPYGLVARLNVLSNNLRRLVIGPLWRPPLYTDGKTKEYAKDLKVTTKKGTIDRVV